MAEAEHLHYSEQIPQTSMTPTPPSTSTPMSSMPLQLSGFLSGDTIQVEGDTGNLQFSLQFNIHNKSLSKNHNNFHFPCFSSPDNNNISCQGSSFASFLTPRRTQEIENENQNVDYSGPSMMMIQNHDENIEIERTAKPDNITNRRDIMTRLRSGAISQVMYFPPKECRDLRSCMSLTVKRKRKKREKGKIALEKLLQKRCCPVKPCSSYVFFVMARWGSVKSSSFCEASKRLSQIWCKLPRKHKKIFEDMALKDSARYKRQLTLLNCKEQNPSPNQNSSNIDAMSTD